jgi:gliding motility-associated-like protein
MMNSRKIIFSIQLFTISNLAFSQGQFLSTNGYGNALILCNTQNCCEKSLGIYYQFADIAATPNGEIYGLAGDIFKIDTTNKLSVFQCTPTDIHGNITSGVGLVALNNDFLITDFMDSLFKVDINTGLSQNLGYIGHYCNGDLAFFQDTLYMASSYNDLIKITLDPIDNHVTNVDSVGNMNLFGSIFSLFTTYDNENLNQLSLFAIDFFDVARVNTKTAKLTTVCTLSDSHYSYGAASLFEFEDSGNNFDIPNIITPNNDNFNDSFIISKKYNAISLQIYNRWGNLIYKSENSILEWDGKVSSDKYATDGVYYYVITTSDCLGGGHLSGCFTLIK